MDEELSFLNEDLEQLSLDMRKLIVRFGADDEECMEDDARPLSHRAPFAHEHATMADLGDIVGELMPTVLIGAFATPNVLTSEIIKNMASFNKTHIIFASKAECTAVQAYVHFE